MNQPPGGTVVPCKWSLWVQVSTKIPMSLRSLMHPPRIHPTTHPPTHHAPTLSRPGPCGWGPRRSAAPGAGETSLQLSPPLSLKTLKSKDSPCIYFPVFVPYPSPKTWASAVHVVGMKSTDAWWVNGYVKSGEINTLWKRDCLSVKGMV